MGKLSQYARERIVSLWSSLVPITKIANIFVEEGIQTSRSAVSLFLSRYRRNGGNLRDAPRSGRKSLLKEEHLEFIDEKMKANDELTSAEIKIKLVDEFGVDVSQSTIRRVRREQLGWRHENSRYCQFVREPNKIKRLFFCLNALAVNDAFEDVIFTDETSVQIEQYARFCFRKEGTQGKRKGRPKHPLKVLKF